MFLAATVLAAMVFALESIGGRPLAAQDRSASASTPSQNTFADFPADALELPVFKLRHTTSLGRLNVANGRTIDVSLVSPFWLEDAAQSLSLTATKVDGTDKAWEISAGEEPVATLTLKDGSLDFTWKKRHHELRNALLRLHSAGETITVPLRRSVELPPVDFDFRRFRGLSALDMPGLPPKQHLKLKVSASGFPSGTRLSPANGEIGLGKTLAIKLPPATRLTLELKTAYNGTAAVRQHEIKLSGKYEPVHAWIKPTVFAEDALQLQLLELLADRERQVEEADAQIARLEDEADGLRGAIAGWEASLPLAATGSEAFRLRHRIQAARGRLVDIEGDNGGIADYERRIERLRQDLRRLVRTSVPALLDLREGGAALHYRLWYEIDGREVEVARTTGYADEK